MLRLLRIRNLALVRELEIEFGPGLNLLTGETGSGKSILVDALGLTLGARSSQEMIRAACDTAVLEGLFDLDRAAAVHSILAETGFDADDNLLIRREISSTGRNRVFINNGMATLSLLKTIGEKLADIHGQQDQKTLLDLSTHLEWLDYFGGNAQLVKETQERYNTLHEIASQLDCLETNEQERLRRIDILKFQINEIRSINPQPKEIERLESERNLLSNREKVLALSTEAYEALYENDSSILSLAGRLERILEELSRYDKSWGAHREALQDSRYKLEDLAFAVRDYTAESDFSPERLEHVHQRLYALEKLLKKYGSSVEDIVDYAGKCEKELEEILSYADTSARLSGKLLEEESKYLEIAGMLSKKRRQDAERLERESRKEFDALAMERMELHVRFYPQKEGEKKGRLPCFYGLNGIDHVEFLIAPNKGEELRPLARIASGGELSRLMLAINSLCGASEAGKTLVFDEVDAGIGGRVAEAVGKRLRDISDNSQVLCVTHLPQIAAFARSHFTVRKEVIGGRTETLVSQVEESDRMHEIARMLGGETITETTRQYAKEMLERSSLLTKLTK